MGLLLSLMTLCFGIVSLPYGLWKAWAKAKDDCEARITETVVRKTDSEGRTTTIVTKRINYKQDK